MNLRYALSFSLLALPITSIAQAEVARAQEPAPTLAGQFQQICGTTGEAGPALPGEDRVGAARGSAIC